MKKIIICMAMLFTLAANAAPTAINELVIQNFNRLFPEAQDVKWYDGSTYFEVAFKEKEFICKVLYDLRGNVISTFRYYEDAARLCPFISSKVQGKYKNKSIIGIIEIHTDSSTLYQVILQDEKYGYIINCDNEGNMHLENKYEKG